MPLDDILLDCEDGMEKAVEHLRHELRGLRAGRASPALVEHMMVEYYGTPTALKNIAAISVPEATQLLIKPFEQSVLKAVEKAFQESKIQATPRSDGKSLRLILPAMSQDVRIKMVATCKTKAEEAKIKVRNSRRDANKLVDTEQKGGILTEDDVVNGKEQVTELTKTYEAKIDEIIEKKRVEVMEV